jgi:hypothetical protein
LPFSTQTSTRRAGGCGVTYVFKCVRRENWRYDCLRRARSGGNAGNSERIHRFIEAFEKLYGRKPKPDDADGDFKIQVARDMQMSIGGARYYFHLATQQKEQN